MSMGIGTNAQHPDEGNLPGNLMQLHVASGLQVKAQQSLK